MSPHSDYTAADLAQCSLDASERRTEARLLNLSTRIESLVEELDQVKQEVREHGDLIDDLQRNT